MSPDFRQFQQMMEIEFGIRFNKLFRGPGWSGEERTDMTDTMKVSVDIKVFHKIYSIIIIGMFLFI